ncbi:hypothetical protein KIN20_032587 [Parelaphostrongylus tenuis]|uniref:Uncharacterized protein n=1 Tax=Parelaphostrongylus tenuis TaxID=148309 RepID=A0AAD5R6U1_PARTN|nr:hypothetical protein KIN20_032587 [Parelaphostrongylus tenuis]
MSPLGIYALFCMLAVISAHSLPFSHENDDIVGRSDSGPGLRFKRQLTAVAGAVEGAVAGAAQGAAYGAAGPPNRVVVVDNGYNYGYGNGYYG